MRGAAWNPQYHQAVLATDPIAYWLQDEKQGGVSYDWVRRRQGSNQDGAYTGVTLGEPGIGDGRTAPFFDGANDYNNIYTAAFAGRFNGSEGSVMVWAKVANAGVWTDGAERRIFELLADLNNLVEISKLGGANQIWARYISGGVPKAVVLAPFSSADWMNTTVTWSVTADEMLFSLNGAQVGAIQNGLGAWVGNLVTASIGSYNLTPISVWHGYIAHAAVWDRSLPPDEVAHLYNEGFV